MRIKYFAVFACLLWSAAWAADDPPPVFSGALIGFAANGRSSWFIPIRNCDASNGGDARVLQVTLEPSGTIMFPRFGGPISATCYELATVSGVRDFVNWSIKNTVQQINAQMLQQDEIARLEKALADRDAKIEDVKQELASLRKTVDDLMKGKKPTTPSGQKH